MTSHRVPKLMEATFNTVTAITDEFCRVHLDDNYGELARKAAATLARKSPSPLVKGNAKSWAGGILYALAKVNHLGGGEGQPFSSLGELCDLLGIGRSTGIAKGGEVIDALKIRPLECKWLHPDVLANDPRAWLLDVGGMIVDARQLPVQMQQQAFRLGLIPFVPSDDNSRKAVGERDAVLAEYQRWRRLNTDIQTALAADVMIDGTAIKMAVRLGIAKTPASARQSESMRIYSANAELRELTPLRMAIEEAIFLAVPAVEDRHVALIAVIRMSWFKLKQPMGTNYSVTATDITNTKRALNQLGYYNVPSHRGIDDWTDDAMFDGIRGFQKANGLKVDGFMRPGGPTETAINQHLRGAASPYRNPINAGRLFEQFDLSNTGGCDDGEGYDSTRKW